MEPLEIQKKQEEITHSVHVSEATNEQLIKKNQDLLEDIHNNEVFLLESK